MNKYKVMIHCVVFTADIQQKKQYILSLSKDDIVFPHFECTNEFLENTEDMLHKFLKQYIYVSENQLLSQIINLHAPLMSDDPEVINVIYGFVTDHTPSIHDAYWYEFDYTIQHKHTDVILEATQKLK